MSVTFVLAFGEVIPQVRLHFLANFYPIFNEIARIFSDFWPEFAALHFLANFYPIFNEIARIFDDYWPKFAVLHFLANFYPIFNEIARVFGDFWPKFAGHLHGEPAENRRQVRRADESAHLPDLPDKVVKSIIISGQIHQN
jgi:hypothetical protein